MEGGITDQKRSSANWWYEGQWEGNSQGKVGESGIGHGGRTVRCEDWLMMGG